MAWAQGWTRQTQPAPCAARAHLIQLVLKRVVQRHQCGGLKLVPGFAERLCGDHLLFEGGVVECAEKLIQLGLQRTAGLVEQEKNQVAEGQAAVSGEIGGFLAMGSDEVEAIKQAGYFVYSFQAGSGW